MFGSAMDRTNSVEAGDVENHPEPLFMPIPQDTPCKREQEKLSGVVKNVHRKLRRKYKEGKRVYIAYWLWHMRDSIGGLVLINQPDTMDVTPFFFF